MRLKLALLMVLALFILSCQTPQTEAATSMDQNVATSQNVVPSEFKKLLESNANGVVVDVRTAREVSTSKIEGAQNIDVRSSNFKSEVAQLDKSKTYFLYCRSGGRSKSASDYFVSQGLNVVNLQGGILGWQSSGYSVVK